MLYNYLTTVYKVIVGLVTPERLMSVALGAFAFYIVWMCISLFTSFQRKFNSRCQELINMVIKTKDIEKTPELVDKKADKISSGFGFGWKKFRAGESGKPSDYIKRREALDVEVNGGLLNNGKTMMRAYITFVTTILFIFNFAYVGGEKTITFITVAESAILPFVFYVVIKLFYFLHNSIRQKLYRVDIESFYEVIDLLDTRFAKKGKFVMVENEKEESNEEPEEASEEEQVEEPEEEKEEDSLDKYDVFKKKNIDVSKLSNEGLNSNSKLPYINVDSDYVIKDDEPVGAKQITQNDNMSTILGGMMQNTSGLKKKDYVDIEKNVAEIDEEKLEKLAQAEKAKEEVQEETQELSEINVDAQLPELEPENESVEQVQEIQEEPVIEKPADEDDGLDGGVSSSSKYIEIEKNEKLEKQQEDISNVVSGFKVNRSKLASGGVVIERNEPIAKRERSGYFAENNEVVSAPTENVTYEEPVKSQSYEQPVINHPMTSENTDNVLNSLKSVPGAYDNYQNPQNFAPSTNYDSMNYNQNYGYTQQMYGQQIPPQMPGYGYVGAPNYSGYNASEPNYGGGYSQLPEENYDDFEEESVVEETPKKKKIVRTKENEPRPRNLKTKEKKAEKEEVSNMAKRGRPKKQEVSESMVIENDKQFNEVLSRAEKLMRKSDEGLSESQSKRIEKEIKILMDAMNRYKESK